MADCTSIKTNWLGLANVVELSPRHLPRERNPRSPIGRASPAAVVLEFEGTTRSDGAVLRRVAPWLQKDVDMIEEWRRCLFMSRLARHVDAAVGLPIVANIDWKIRRGSDIKGKIATHAGNLIITMSGWGACFEGHRDALLSAGLARANWLVAGPHRPSANKFETNIFDALRKVTIHRNRDRYVVSVDLTDEERSQVAYDRVERLDKAKSALESGVKSLPSSRGDYLRHVVGCASLMTGALEALACDSKGGFSLDDTSRAAILTQLDGLRQAIHRATATFDTDKRHGDIVNLAQNHAPEFRSMPNPIT